MILHEIVVNLKKIIQWASKMTKQWIISVGIVLLGLLGAPYFCLASTESNSSSCSGTLITTVISTTCSGSQDFPDDGGGNVPVDWTNYPSGYSGGVSVDLSSPLNASGNAIMTSSVGSSYLLIADKTGPYQYFLSTFSYYLGGYITLYSSTGQYVGKALVNPYAFASSGFGLPDGELEFVDFSTTSNASAVSIIADTSGSGANSFCGTSSFFSCLESNDLNSYYIIPFALGNSSTSPTYIQDSGNISFALTIIIVFCFLAFCGYMYSKITAKKQWL